MGQLEDIVSALQKQYGSNGAQKLDEFPDASGVRGWTTSGVPDIDELVGRPGIPDGRVTTIIGPPGGSKTTLATHYIVGMQKRGGTVIYWDNERSYYPDRAQRIGVDPTKFVMGYPETCEEAFSMLATICAHSDGKTPVLVVWDTFSATPVVQDLYGTGDAAKKRIKDGIIDESVSLGEKGLGAHARIASVGLRKLQGLMEEKQVTLLVILQSKEDISITFGSGVSYLAQKPWFFYSNVQFECKYIGKVGPTEGDPIGIKVEVFCRKNKVGKPFRKAVIECMFDDGIDVTGLLLEKGIEKGIISVKGGGYLFVTATGEQFTRRTQGNSKSPTWKDIITGNPTLAKQIKEAP